MQIVQKLAGYTMGQADNIRRAMSKKKQYVIDAERKNFIYGDEEQGIKGCVANGISEKAANSIYDSMVDFAKYAFNKSHAAAYALISVQTAWLKYYYPVEFMAALMTSVIDNSVKASEYLYHCKEMGIEVLSPDINVGRGAFTTEGNNIRYGMYAIKGLGRSVVDSMIEERKIGGSYRTLQDFIKRMAQKDINKRAIENLIKAGACDSLDGTRKQMSMVYSAIIDQITTSKKTMVVGQMSLFDFASEEDKKDYEINYPNVGEFEKEEKLGFEKEVLGIYLSGHPLEEYMDKMKKNVTHLAADFVRETDSDEAKGVQGSELKVEDNQQVIVGGMISDKTVKFTKTNKAMAFISLEDLTGTIEVVIFPKHYEKYQQYLQVEKKVFIIGHASVEEEQNGKIICEKIIPFEETPRELWLQFSTKEEYIIKEQTLQDILNVSEGIDEVVIYVANPKAMKRLGKNQTVNANIQLIEQLSDFLGQKNVKVIEKCIENNRKTRYN